MYVCYPIAITICIKIGYVHVKKLILNKKKGLFFNTYIFFITVKEAILKTTQSST